MKPSSAVIVLLAIAPLSAIAGPASPTRVLSCASPNWPTRLQVAHYLATPRVIVGENAGAPSPAGTRQAALLQAEQVAAHVRRAGRLECWHGATHLLVTFHPPLQQAVASATVVAGDGFAAAP